MDQSNITTYRTHGGLDVTRTTELLPFDDATNAVVNELDAARGVLLTSTYEYPGRYTRWDIAFVDPALSISAWGRDMELHALNDRGGLLLRAFNERLDQLLDDGLLNGFERGSAESQLSVNHWTQAFTEEDRSRQPSVFSVLRDFIQMMSTTEDSHLGLYGAFGYDLAFQFEPVSLRQPRDGRQRDLVLYVPDDLIVVDHQRELAQRFVYEFEWAGSCTAHTPRSRGDRHDFGLRPNVQRHCDHAPGEYAATIERARDAFKRGDMFEVVPGQTFSEGSPVQPSELFRRLRDRNPAPYGALMNLGEDEYLVSASPEMYVRVEGRRVETCPISGTIERGKDVFEDAENIRTLLNSTKDESELTMCTDVDRNDKSRVCVPESIQVIGRRQIEAYSRLFHTVDHVEGTLLPQFDGLDAFLAHAWAVTVTGAPKLWAMRFIEQEEKSPRAWYGGAIGALTFDGNVNTGLTLRTIHVKAGVASVRAGATALIDSDPDSEERETRTKASALLDAIRHQSSTSPQAPPTSHVGAGRRVLLVDHEDSFVHTLAGYLRRTGADVTTIRVPMGSKLEPLAVTSVRPHLAVISPGPGRPQDFSLSQTLDLLLEYDIPIFGVCLGLQALVEHFGGELEELHYPAHGRMSKVVVTNGRIFEGLPAEFNAGRYHSLYAPRYGVPDVLHVTAQSDDGVVMAVEHKSLPAAAVQFHPESLMTMRGDVGFRLTENVMRLLALEPDGNRSP